MSLLKTSVIDSAGWPGVSQATHEDDLRQTESDSLIDSSRGHIICVLGMHRSGTSVATRVLNLLGVFLGAGDNLLSAGPDNPKGFWEYQPIVDLNVEILERLGGKWHEPPAFPAGWETAAEFADLRKKARALVSRSFASCDWGWKDPRTCLTLPFWKQILPAVRYVICVRSPVEVAASLEKRDGIPIGKSIRLWQIYTGAAIEHTSGFPRHFIFYEDLIHSHHKEVSRLARFLGRHDALEKPAILEAIEDFIDPDFHRQQISFLNTLDDPQFTFPAKALYVALRIAAKSGRPSFGLSDLPGQESLGEQVWAIFSRYARRAQDDWDGFTNSEAGLQLQISELSAEAHQLRYQLADLDKQAATRDASLAAIQDRSSELQADNRRLSDERAQAEAVARELRAALDAREIACQGLTRDIAGRDTEIAALGNERAALVHRIDQDTVAHQAEIEMIQARLGAIEADNHRLEEERAHAEAIAGELRAGRDEREAACQALSREIAGRDARIAELGGERLDLVQQIEKDREARQAEIETLHARSSAIATDNRRLDEERTQAEAKARELRARLDERDSVVALLESRFTELLVTRADEDKRTRALREMETGLEARIVELAGQIGGLAAEFAQLGSREGSREAALLQIRDQLVARHDDLQAMISRLSGTVDYRGMVRRVRTSMRTLLPPAVPVIVISKGDPELLGVEGREMWHFPQDVRGNYAGHYPAESGEAIAHLEALRARGGRFLVIPSSASWWLEHYRGLAHHLDVNYQTIWKNADCQIFELDSPDRSPVPEPGAREITEVSPTLQANDMAPPIASPAPSVPATLSAAKRTPGPAPETLSNGSRPVRARRAGGRSRAVKRVSGAARIRVSAMTNPPPKPPALAEHDERLSLADCRQLATIADFNFHLGQLADQQDRMAAANRQFAEELRGELHRALEANRAASEAALARQEERSSLADRQGLHRHRQLIQAVAQMVQPIVDLQRELDRPSAEVDEHPAPSLLEPVSSRSITATPAPPAPEPGSILATCDMPGPDPVSIGPGHLRVRGWALSKAGIEDVRVFIDGLPREGVSYGAVRFDVEAVHPELPNAHHSGFIGKIDLEELAEGEHSLVVRVRSRDGREMELIRSFRLDPNARPDRWDLNAEYPVWLARRIPSESDLARMRIEGENLPYRPVISLVVPVYNTPEEFLSLMVDSVMAQTYGNWELCLADDASTAPHVRPFLDRLARRDARVKFAYLPRNRGISGASNAALALATGGFIGLLDHDDVLAPSALFEVVSALNDAPATDLIYSDEDKVDDTGRERWDPFFKPDWSPDLLLSTNYVCHFGVYRRSLVEGIGGFRPEYDGSQDYDLVLRFTEQTDRIVHLPSVLYSWRAVRGSAARDMMAKPYAVDAARRAVDDALRRRGLAGRVEPGYSLGQWRVRYDLRGQPAVTVVIPTGGNMKCLQQCLESVLEGSTYSNLHVLVTDDSDGTAVADFCRALGRRDPRLKYRRFRLKPFNYSAINNSAMSLVDTPYVVLLNDDITVITPDWVEAMLEHAQRPEVGVVGAKLLYPDRSLQHAGVIMGPYKNCGHAFKHFCEDDPGYFGLARAIRNCSAVTFACAMMRRSVFDEVGGLDEQNVAMAFNDVDMCLQIRERGYWVVYTPYAVLFHHESATRNMHSNPGEEEYMRRRWSRVIRHDPFYNPNLTREAEDYSLNFDAPSIARLEQQTPRPTPERDAPVASRVRAGVDVPRAQYGERAGGDGSVERRAAGDGEHIAPGSLPTAAPPAIDAPESVNGYRPRRISYPQVRRRIREVVNAELPTGSVVVVVSRGDDSLLQLGPRRGWHFPQTEAGVYAGFYPADSGEAIAHLEEIRRKGGDYLLFPSTAFWWLGFYGHFQKYLEAHYPCVCSDPSCLIFQLSPTSGGGS